MTHDKNRDRDNSNTVPLADLRGQPFSFELKPGKPVLEDICGSLDLLDLRKLRFAGTLVPNGTRDWRLEADLGATVVQPCRVTLAPVKTRIEERVSRTYSADAPDPGPGEVEMPDDDTIEPLPDIVDLDAVMREALALALPSFPRAEGAAIEIADFTEPGKTPMSDDDAKPFAGLAALKNKLESPDD